MRTQYEAAYGGQIEIKGRLSAGDDKIVTSLFPAVARLCWPEKTAAHLAAICGREERTAKRWLSGEFDPPIEIAPVLLTEIFRKR